MLGSTDTSGGAALEAPPRPDLHRVCTECGKQLRSRRGRRVRNDAKTCTATCRTARNRRLERERKRVDREPGAGQGTEAIRPLVPTTGGQRVRDILTRVMQEELRPIVREQITQDTLRAIQGLVALTPVMVEAIGRDLESADPTIRQRAYSVMARYTLGHSAIVTPPEESARQTMTVIFDGMVRPGQTAPTVEADEPYTLDAGEMKTCNSCDARMPADQFVEHSDRCINCHDALQARMRDVLGEGDGLA